jgi:hypothetical protein
VSVDSSGFLPRAVTLAAVLDSARTTTRTLLGMTAVPELAVVTDVHTTSRTVLRPEQETTLLGGDAGFWEAGLPGTDHWVRLIPGRGWDESAVPLGLTDDEDRLWLLPSVNCVPARTAVAMVLSLGLALGAALAGGGQFTTQLTVRDRGVLTDPARVIAAASIPPAELSFGDACLRFMDRFPGSKPGTGW